MRPPIKIHFMVLELWAGMLTLLAIPTRGICWADTEHLRSPTYTLSLTDSNFIIRKNSCFLLLMLDLKAERGPNVGRCIHNGCVELHMPMCAAT